MDLIRNLAAPATKEKEVVKTATFVAPQFHVILLDDDNHTYDYVIEMLVEVFGHSQETAYRMACEVDASGFVVVDTTHRDRAELKCEQIKSYGKDWRIGNCPGSMSAIVEVET